MASSFWRRMDSQYLESWISFISSRPFYPLYYIIKYHWYLYKKFLPHFTGIARYSNLVEELMLFDEGGSVRVVWPPGVIMWTQGRVETGDQGTRLRWPATGPSVTLLSLLRGAAVRRGLVAVLCNTSDTGAVTLGDQRSSAVDTILICISWSSTHATSGNLSEIF